MAHQWDRGVLSASSWHGLEEVGTFDDAASAIAHGERTGAWPVALRVSELRTPDGLRAPKGALVASYAAFPDRVVGCVGDRYRATAPNEWRDLVTAAVTAGAKPTGTFSLCDGSRALATFEVGTSNGIRTQFLLADSFDGSLSLLGGFTSIRVVCANTLAVALRKDGSGMAGLRHTASLETKVNAMADAIGAAIKTGEKVKTAFAEAEASYMSEKVAGQAFDALFPPAGEGASKLETTLAENARQAARNAAAMPINRVGERPGNVATLWNAATYLIDRTDDGSSKRRAGSDALNTLLFGSRGKRLQEIHEVIEVVMRDGSTTRMTPREALDHGCDAKSIGRSILEDMLA